jgi:Arc/MetJ-type ribon-helix-helix transcriptional regulator
MSRHLDPDRLPEKVARYAEAQVAAGNFDSIEDVLAAGVEVLRQREEDWADYAKGLWAERTAAADRGEFAEDDYAQVMARIRARVDRAE